MDEAKEQVLYGLAHCHILKISDNEIQWLTGEEDYTAGVNWIRERYQIQLILVSMGKEGSRAYYNGTMVEVNRSFRKIQLRQQEQEIHSVVVYYIIFVNTEWKV